MSARPAEEILAGRRLDPGPAAAYLGEEDAGRLLGWPAGAVRAAVAHPRLRRRVALAMTRRLGLDADGFRAASALLPRGPEVLERAAMMFGLATALASHRGVFRKEDYARLIEDFGRPALDFAVRHRTLGRPDPALPGLPVDPVAVLEFGMPEIVRALAAADHPLARILAPPAPAPTEPEEAAPPAGEAAGELAEAEPAEPEGDEEQDEPAEVPVARRPAHVKRPVIRPPGSPELALAALAAAREQDAAARAAQAGPGEEAGAAGGEEAA